MRTYKLIAEPKEKGNLQKIVRYVYCTSDNPQENDLKLHQKMEEFEKTYDLEKYIHHCWEV